jgi:hypothetical protein
MGEGSDVCEGTRGEETAAGSGGTVEEDKESEGMNREWDLPVAMLLVPLS